MVNVKDIGIKKVKKMAKKVVKTYKLTDLTIGSKVFVVHKQQAFAKKPGGKVNQGRIVSFVNKSGEVEPEFRLVGQPAGSSNLSIENYVVFTDIKQAVNAIKS